MDTFHKNGALAALMNEYKKAITELQVVLGSISDDELVTIVDSETKDDNCRSIQSILSHVVRAGYWYILEIRQSLGEPIEPVELIVYTTVPKYQLALDRMFQFNEKLAQDHADLKLEEHDPKKKIIVKWGQQYDVEQLLEHAIVHILRHRRQIERFISILR